MKQWKLEEDVFKQGTSCKSWEKQQYLIIFGFHFASYWFGGSRVLNQFQIDCWYAPLHLDNFPPVSLWLSFYII